MTGQHGLGSPEASTAGASCSSAAEDSHFALACCSPEVGTLGSDCPEVGRLDFDSLGWGMVAAIAASVIRHIAEVGIHFLVPEAIVAEEVDPEADAIYSIEVFRCSAFAVHNPMA